MDRVGAPGGTAVGRGGAGRTSDASDLDSGSASVRVQTCPSRLLCEGRLSAW